MHTTYEQDTVIGTTHYEARGTHLLLTLTGCSSSVIHDADRLKELVQAAAEATGATVLEIVAHRFQPQGTTVIAVLAESHASLHTYPESKTVFWDCFTCGSSCCPDLSEDLLVKALSPSKVNKQIVVRE
jgi:S-adenosylmethionine decarboxylase proenzyme